MTEFFMYWNALGFFFMYLNVLEFLKKLLAIL